MEQWENLDIDTSDLASFVRRCNTNKSLIPGPAGNVQAVILNRKSKEPVNTQEFINNIADENHRRDFDSNPWNWAQHFLHFHGQIDGHDCEQISSLANIKQHSVFPLLTCVVKECQPNGLRDMLITIKDPTATVRASVHAKVLKDPEFGSQIAVGSVLVAIFSPNQRAFYLNITVKNIVKVFKFDICPPSGEEVRSCHPVIRDPPTLDAKQLELLNKMEEDRIRSSKMV
ncbi:uncharacterized protein [Phaseolus vulgaris]|uniref:uncharacterized protein n=1 Tax=Phaseolus vulgaris TaxID=3885 RepID=UPI0035CC1AA4